jgi:type III secretory pathway component EscV
LVIGAMDAPTSTQFKQNHQAMGEVAPEWLLPAVWVPESHLHKLRTEGIPNVYLEILEPAQVIARLVMRTIQRKPEGALGVQEVRQLVRDIEWRFSDLVREAQAILPLSRLADVMAALARERVPMADFSGLLQAVVTYGPSATDANSMYESLRLALARAIVARLLPPQTRNSNRTDPAASINKRATLTAVTLDTAFEAKLRAALIMRADGPILALSPEDVETAMTGLITAFEQAAPHGTKVLVLSAPIRRAASRLFRDGLPRAAFLSDEELSAASVVGVSTAVAYWTERERPRVF